MSKQDKFIFRPRTIPVSRTNRSRSRRRGRREEGVLESQAVQRPNDNFFRVVFQRDTYLWVIFHRFIKRIDLEQMASLYGKFKECYKGLDKMPICTQLSEVKYWLKDYQCKVAIDESVIEYFQEIIGDPKCIMVKVVTQKNIAVVRQVRNSKFSYKIRSVDDSYEEIVHSVGQDMQKVKIVKESQKLEKVRLPNFMKLKIKDKADLITYRNNIYCLASLHRNRVDMQTSKKRFIEQCEKMYTTPKDKEHMKYYLTYPFNDREILRFYTEDSFFYRCLNNTLRMARTTQEFYIIGEPFNKMFHAIKNIYKQQYPYSQSRKNLKLYRGADLSDSQGKYLQSCIGSYIEIHGFVSTTLDQSVAQKFAKDRNHKRILEIIFEDAVDPTSPVLENDYGFVNLVDISRYQQNEILFNTLNIFKVIGKESRDGFEYFTLKYGTIFNILNKGNPELLKRNDRLAYYTYKELMGEKDNLKDLGQVFLKSNQTQKSVDYYQAKILQAKSQNRHEEIIDLMIKKSQALILNGEPAKALEHMMFLLTERKTIKQTVSGARFLESVLSDKEEIIKEIDITKKYSEAGHSLDKFDEAESQLIDANDAIEDALRQTDGWNFDIAFGQFQVKMQLVYLKQSLQDYKGMMDLLKQAEILIDSILQKVRENDVSFHDQKKVFIQKTLIFQLMAKISPFLDPVDQANLDDLQQKYSETQSQLSNLIQDKSYDRSLVQIRKVQIERRREDFNANKRRFMNQLQQSLINIKQSSSQDSEIPKTYHMLAQIQKQSKSVASTNNAISYLQKELMTQSQYYGDYDPRPMKTVIDIAQCHRTLKDSQESIDMLREQMKITPFRNKDKHTIVTKTLYTMGMAYLDIGEYSYALKCLEKGLLMLKEILSKKQFDKFHHRYKIELQLGRTYTFLLRYNEAEERLLSYHNFIVKLYKNQHSDVANSLNYFAILYLKMKNIEKAREKFEESADMFKMTSGEKALVVAKIKCNLGMVYAVLEDKDKALRKIDQAQYLFNEIYSGKEQYSSQERFVHPQTHQIYFYYAEIHKMFREYKQAIENYTLSKDTLLEYKAKKKRERELKGYSASSQYFNPSTRIENKKDNHELICRVKIIECQARLKDYTFWKDLEKVIKELQKETIQYNQVENTKISDSNDRLAENGLSQLNNLLKYCRGLYKHYEIRKEQTLSNQLLPPASQRQEGSTQAIDPIIEIPEENLDADDNNIMITKIKN